MPWINIENMMNERSPSQKTTCSMISFIWNIQMRQIRRHRKISIFQGLAGRGDWEWLLMDIGYFWGYEHILILDSGDGYTILWIYK
jgi:hypothetical protein